MELLRSSYLSLRAEALCEVISAKERGLCSQCTGCRQITAPPLLWLLGGFGDWSKNKEIGSLPLVKANLLRTDIGGMHKEWGRRKATPALARSADSTPADTHHRQITLACMDGQLYPSFEDEFSVLLFHKIGSLFLNLFFFHVTFLSALSTMNVYKCTELSGGIVVKPICFSHPASVTISTSSSSL